LNQKDIIDLNRAITSNEIEAGIQDLPEKKSAGPKRFTAKFYQTFKKELIPTLLRLSQPQSNRGK
jgi:hypothetical protein